MKYMGIHDIHTNIYVMTGTYFRYTENTKIKFSIKLKDSVKRQIMNKNGAKKQTTGTNAMAGIPRSRSKQ